MQRHKLIHKPPPLLVGKREIGSILKSNSDFPNGAGQRFHPFHMRPIIQRINSSSHFSVLDIFDREGIGQDRVFRLLVVEPPHFICMAASR